MVPSDSLFLTLPLRLQRLIDEAFDSTTDPDYTVYDKAKDKANDTIPQQNPTIGAGGFLVESYESRPNTSNTDEGVLDSQNNKRRSSIPLSSIPSALQLLDLAPDDSEVLSVFKNAASGWSSGSTTSFEGINPQENFVSREDWHSVCAVLLEHRNSEVSGDESLSRNWQDVDLDSESLVDLESVADSTESSGDEYMVHHIRPRKKVQAQHRQSTSRLASPPLHLTSTRQKETCFKTFALFFPEVPHHKLADHRIMIKDLQRVSKLLGETIRAEEVSIIFFLWMIFYFSL